VVSSAEKGAVTPHHTDGDGTPVADDVEPTGPSGGGGLDDGGDE